MYGPIHLFEPRPYSVRTYDRYQDAAVARYSFPSRTFAACPTPPVVTGTLPFGIFIVDAIPSLDIIVAVLYVVVVLLSLYFSTRRGILLAGVVRMALTIRSYLLSHDVPACSTPPS
jgi:hypothetical protein